MEDGLLSYVWPLFATLSLSRLTSRRPSRPDNDAQYGNLLLLRDPLPPPAPKHHSIIVVDFEYSSPNPYPYDIANHFSEWQADYHHSTQSYSLSDHGKYPTKEERYNFYKSYLEVSKGRPAREEELSHIDRGVEVWRPAGSANWALWGVISGEAQVDALERGDGDWAPDWEYLVRFPFSPLCHPLLADEKADFVCFGREALCSGASDDVPQRDPNPWDPA